MLSRVTYHSYQRYSHGSQLYAWQAVTLKVVVAVQLSEHDEFGLLQITARES